MTGQQVPYEVLDTNRKRYRVVDTDLVQAMQQVANRHDVAVIAWRYSRHPNDCLHIWKQHLEIVQ